MTILVTGGAGFIGANFVLDWLAQADEPVINLDKLTYAGNLENLSSLEGDKRHVFVQGDIADTQLLQRLLAEHTPRAILNFAAESHVDRSIHGPEDFIETNVVGTFRLLEVVRAYWKNLPGDAQQAFRFLHVSTDEVYGSLSKDEPAFTEHHQYEPNSPYSASKAASDHLVRAYHHTYGLPVLTTNCSNNYGPYQRTIDQVTADAAAARASADSMHGAVDDLASRLAASETSGNSCTAAASKAATRAAMVLADVLKRADQRAGELAATADQARARGMTCEQAYDGLGR